MHAFVFASRRSIIALDGARKVYTLLHIAILQKFEDDVALRLTRIEVVISLFVIIFLGNHTILSLCYFEIICSAVHTQGVGFGSYRCRLPHGRRIGVHRNEKISLVAVGYLGTSLQRNKNIGFARVNHFNIGTIFLHQSS